MKSYTLKYITFNMLKIDEYLLLIFNRAVKPVSYTMFKLVWC